MENYSDEAELVIAATPHNRVCTTAAFLQACGELDYEGGDICNQATA